MLTGWTLSARGDQYSVCLTGWELNMWSLCLHWLIFGCCSNCFLESFPNGAITVYPGKQHKITAFGAASTIVFSGCF